MKKPGNAGGAKARQEGGCVESMTKQEELSKVEETPKQGREAESQKWSWVEAEVWTERMLTTLETGVKGGKNAYFIEQGLFTMAVAPTDWRAGCGRTARPVRREGRLKPMSFPYPYLFAIM